MSLRELAVRSGLPVSTIHRIEAERVSPSFETLTRVARGLGCTLGVEFLPAPASGIAGWSAASRRVDDPHLRVRLAAELVTAATAAGADTTSTEPMRFDDERWDAFTAALAEHISASTHTPAPAWLSRWPDRLAEPWWVVDLPSLRAIIAAATPLAFKRRGIYIERDALVNR